MGIRPGYKAGEERGEPNSILMKLPVSFGEVSYFEDEYRGDLIVTDGAIYFFPTRRSAYNKIYLFGGMPDKIVNWIARFLVIGLGGISVVDIAEFASGMGRFAKRSTAQEDRPQIANLGLWQNGQTSTDLQQRLDGYIQKQKAVKSGFTKNDLPKPAGFRRCEMDNIKFGWRFKFDARYDDHDFGISPFRRKRLREALRAGGLL